MKVNSRLSISIFSLISSLGLFLSNYFYIFKVYQSDYDYTNYYLKGFEEFNLVSHSDMLTYDKNICYFEDQINCNRQVKFYYSINSLKNISYITFIVTLLTGLFFLISLKLNLNNNVRLTNIFYMIAFIFAIMNFYSSLILTIFTWLSFIRIEALAFYGYNSVGRVSFSFVFFIVTSFITFLVGAYIILSYVTLEKTKKEESDNENKLYSTNKDNSIKL